MVRFRRAQVSIAIHRASPHADAHYAGDIVIMDNLSCHKSSGRPPQATLNRRRRPPVVPPEIQPRPEWPGRSTLFAEAQGDSANERAVALREVLWDTDSAFSGCPGISRHDVPQLLSALRLLGGILGLLKSAFMRPARRGAVSSPRIARPKPPSERVLAVDPILSAHHVQHQKDPGGAHRK